MITEPGLYKLQTWLSPAYPVGAYAFSHGIENAVERALVGDADDACEWIADAIRHGMGAADLVFLSSAYDAAGDAAALTAVLDYALAFQTTAEFRTESLAQGRAFLDVTTKTWPCETHATLQSLAGRGCPYPVAVGVTAAGHGIDRQATMVAYGHAFVSNLVSAAVRLVPLGQTDGQALLARLFPGVSAAVAQAIDTPLDKVATSTVMMDIASMNHETQYTRLFRS